MNRKSVRSWMMYDWANSAFATTMLAAVLPIFYVNVAGKGVEHAASYWGYTNSIAMICVLLLTPVLGAVADYAGLTMRFLRLFAYLGIGATALFVFVGQGDYILASLLMIAGTIGFSGGNTFYDSLLTDLVPYDQRDDISAKGYMFGYIGGGILLVINLVMIEMPELLFMPDALFGTKAAFMSVAIWWFLFSLPLFNNVKVIPIPGQVALPSQYAAIGFKRLRETFRSIRQYPELLKYLLAFWFFNDGISTIIVMATAYGATIGIETKHLILALVITQFVGIPFTFLFGKIAVKLGSKPSLYISLSVYSVIVLLGFFMETATHFYILAAMVGMVQGGSQAIARSIYSKLTPAGRSAEFFGFLTVSSKFSSIVGPFVFGLVSQLTGNIRLGILSLLVFFIAGIGMMLFVNIEKGKLEAERKHII